ncbi:unnamed protein product [Durusdinium trenchii]|uniref:Uncharacterized protein n=1 Tax=Durusdinium trenchii TaxID=1381693 RepID=A0ABP0QNJ6_9DINO
MRQNQWNCIPAQHRFGKSVSVASSWTGWFELAVLVENWKILREYRSCDGHSRKEFAKSNETWEVRSAGLRASTFIASIGALFWSMVLLMILKFIGVYAFHLLGSEFHLVCWAVMPLPRPMPRLVQKALPGLQGLEEDGAGECWGALNFDVRGAHKLVNVTPPEQGLSCFDLLCGQRLMVCLQVLLFWMLVGSLLCSRGYCLPRLALSPISLDQARFFLYVADGLALFPAKAPPLLATSLLYFLAALGAPLSWEKLRMGTPCPVNKSGAQLRLASLAQALRLTKLMGWHVAGVRNEWADDLSRNCLEGFEQGCGGLDQFFDAGKVIFAIIRIITAIFLKACSEVRELWHHFTPTGTIGLGTQVVCEVHEVEPLFDLLDDGVRLLSVGGCFGGKGAGFVQAAAYWLKGQARSLDVISIMHADGLAELSVMSRFSEDANMIMTQPNAQCREMKRSLALLEQTLGVWPTERKLWKGENCKLVACSGSGCGKGPRRTWPSKQSKPPPERAFVSATLRRFQGFRMDATSRCGFAILCAKERPPTSAQAQAAGVSPKSLELKLVQLAPLLQDLQSLCAVSQNWASINAAAWSATHEYLFQEPGTKKDLSRRYVGRTQANCMRNLAVKTWISSATAAVPEGAARGLCQLCSFGSDATERLWVE